MTVVRGRLIAGLTIAALVGLGGVLLRSGGSSGSLSRTQANRDAFSLPALQGGGTVTLSTYRGKPVVVDLFASWCTACRDELPMLARAATALRGQVVFVGVNSGDTGDGQALAHRYGIDNWPLARDIGATESDYHDALGSVGMPIAAFYDAEGRLVQVSQLALTEPELRRILASSWGITLPPLGTPSPSGAS